MATEARMKRIMAVVTRRQQGVIVLEDIQDPHNAQAVVRSADAFGFQRVALVFNNTAPFDPREVGWLSSSTANKWVDFEIYHSPEECINKLHIDGFEVIATALGKRSQSLYKAEFTNPKLAIMFGSENSGLSETAVHLADRVLKIPMRGFVQSLNISVTAAIFLYEVTRQRLAAGMHTYQLDNDSQQSLTQSFLMRR